MVEEITLEKVLERKEIEYEICSIEVYAAKKDDVAWSLIDIRKDKVYYVRK